MLTSRAGFVCVVLFVMCVKVTGLWWRGFVFVALFLSVDCDFIVLLKVNIVFIL